MKPAPWYVWVVRGATWPFAMLGAAVRRPEVDRSLGWLGDRLTSAGISFLLALTLLPICAKMVYCRAWHGAGCTGCRQGVE